MLAHNTLSLAGQLYEAIKSFDGAFNLKKLYSLFPDEKPSTIRGRVYRELIGRGVIEKVSKGVYSFRSISGQEGVIINGDARNLDLINNSSIDLVIADHPYHIAQGSSRSFNSAYEDTSFEYELEDFLQKARVLKDGGFLVEFLPEMKETNLAYIIKIMTVAQEAGFKFYCKIPWYKAEVRDGLLVDCSANVGRKGVLEDVYIFSKGEPRKLRFRNQGGVIRQEKGASSMFPAVFMEPMINPSKRIHKAQKPESLMKKIIAALSLEGEKVLDQFAGSFVTFFSALALNRKAIAIELKEEFIEGLK